MISYQHIQSAGPSNKGLILKRHKFIVEKISKKLVKVHPQVKVFKENMEIMNRTLVHNEQWNTESSQTVVNVLNAYFKREHYATRKKATQLRDLGRKPKTMISSSTAWPPTQEWTEWLPQTNTIN